MHKALPIMILFLYWPPVGHTMAKVSASLTGYVNKTPNIAYRPIPSAIAANMSILKETLC